MSRTPMTDAFIVEARRLGAEVLTHEQWGSVRRGVYADRLRTRPHDLLPGRPVDTLWNHVTVTFDDGHLIGHFKADMREVERIGYERFGTGFSYNLGIDRNADRPRIGIGQFLEARGAHTINDKGVPGYSLNQNKVSLAIAWVGMPGDRLNAHALKAMAIARAALINIGALTRTYDDVPHSLVAAKDCPTSELRNRLAELRRAGLALAGTTPTPVPRPDLEDDMTPDEFKRAFREVLNEPIYTGYGETEKRKLSHILLRTDHGVRRLLAQDLPTASEIAAEIVAQSPDREVDQAVVERGVTAVLSRLTKEDPA